jgi:predicted  nucleic acid-binding Zn-ribbon protein
VPEEKIKQNLTDLRRAVLSGNAGATKEAVEKLAADLFSGSPTENKRRFQLVNEEIAGIGHTIHANDFTEEREENEKKEAQRHAFDIAFEELLDAIQEQKDALIRELEKLGKKYKKIIEHIKSANFDLKDINEQLKALEDSDSENIAQLNTLEDNTMLTYRAIGDLLKNHDPELYEDFFNDVFGIDNEYITIAHDTGDGTRSHIVWQDESGTYYLKDPKTGQRVDINQDNPNLLGALGSEKSQKPASELSQEDREAFERFNSTYKRYMNEVNCHHGLSETHDRLVGIMAKREELFGRQVEIEKEIEELKVRKEQLEKEIEQLEKQKSANEKKTDEIKQKLENLERDETSLLNRMDENKLEVLEFTTQSTSQFNHILAILRHNIETDPRLKEHFHAAGGKNPAHAPEETPHKHAAARHPDHGQTSQTFQTAAAAAQIGETSETGPALKNTSTALKTGATT